MTEELYYGRTGELMHDFEMGRHRLTVVCEPQGVRIWYKRHDDAYHEEESRIIVIPYNWSAEGGQESRANKASTHRPACPLPKTGLCYQMIAEDIQERIRTGEYSGMLPPLPRLAEMYGVTIPTVRAGTRLLEERGIVEARQGIGTIIK